MSISHNRQQGITLDNYTEPHCDGPNDHRKGYQNTIVYSFLVEWKGNIYRVSIICYTRASIGNFLEKNYVALHLRMHIRDHLVEHNGMLHYKDLHLKPRMTKYKVKTTATELAPKKIKSNALNSFRPAKKNLSVAYFERNPNSMWDQSKREYDKNKITGLKWTILPAEDKTLKIILVKEMMNRYGFVSSFAYQINAFTTKHKPTFDHRLQLLYMGLLQTSQIQFFYIMKIMIEKEEGTYKTETNLFREYEKLINKKRLVVNGGNFGRVQCPSLHNYHSLLPHSKRNSRVKKRGGEMSTKWMKKYLNF